MIYLVFFLIQANLYSVKAIDDTMHQYQDNLDELFLPLDNEKLTQFCMLHKKWEKIVVTKIRNKNTKKWKSSYSVKYVKDKEK